MPGAALEQAARLDLLPYPFRGADTASRFHAGWGMAAFQLYGKVTRLQLRRIWRACIKPLQIWRDFAVACPEPTLAPQGGQEPLQCAGDGDAAAQGEKGDTSHSFLCVNSDVADI